MFYCLSYERKFLFSDDPASKIHGNRFDNLSVCMLRKRFNIRNQSAHLSVYNTFTNTTKVKDLLVVVRHPNIFFLYLLSHQDSIDEMTSISFHKFTGLPNVTTLGTSHVILQVTTCNP